MTPNDIITWLRDKLPYAPDHAWKNVMEAIIPLLEELDKRRKLGERAALTAAENRYLQDKIARLKAELRGEIYRHDRLQDFEVAEAEELAELKASNAAMACALKASGGCGNCKHCYAPWNEEPCDSCRQDPGFPKWEWNGCIKGGVQNV